VVSLDAWHAHLPDDIQAFFGIGIVSDHVSQTRIVRAVLLFGVLQDNLEGFEIGVDISDNGASS
jgi:hypothetical protein